MQLARIVAIVSAAKPINLKGKTMSISSIATKELLNRIISSGANPIEANGIMVKVLRIQENTVTLGFDIVDKQGKALVELRTTTPLQEGDTLSIMGLEAAFSFTVVE